MSAGCSRCGGSGYVSSDMYGGVCFACRGASTAALSSAPFFVVTVVDPRTRGGIYSLARKYTTRRAAMAAVGRDCGINATISAVSA